MNAWLASAYVTCVIDVMYNIYIITIYEFKLNQTLLKVIGNLAYIVVD